MRFRTKLLLLLLGISLLPMMLLRWKNQSTAEEMGHEIAARIRSQLISRSSMELKQQVEDHAFLLLRERQLLQLVLRTQAGALEQLLDGRRPYPPVSENEVIDLQYQSQRHCRERGSGQCPAVEVSYDSFAPPLVNSREDTAVFAPLVPVFKDLAARYADMLLWQYVYLPDGSEGVYPATKLRMQRGTGGRSGRTGHGMSMHSRDMPSSRHEAMRLGMAPEWHLQAMQSDAPVWGKPHVDPLTRKPVITVSMPVKDAQGQTVASTAVAVEVAALLRVDDHFDQLSDELETMIVLPVAEAVATASAQKVLQGNIDGGGGGSRSHGPGVLVLARQELLSSPVQGRMGHMRSWVALEDEQWLHSSNDKGLTEVAAEMTSGRAGVVELPYKGRDSLWAFGPIETGGLSLLLIAPKDDLVADADLTQEYVLERFHKVMLYSGSIMAAVLLFVVLLAITVSKRLTRHIESLAQGFERVRQGDFDVRIRVQSKDEIGQLAKGFNTMVPALEERIHMRQALDVAHEIQRSLLPLEPPQIPGLQLAGLSVYSETTGGDYYDYLKSLDAEDRGAHLGLVVGDVTGHGVPAAMLMTTARAFMRLRASLPGGPAEVLADVNHQLSRDVDQTGRFMTLFYAEYVPQTRLLRWARAGHEPALLYSAQTQSFSELAGQGLPLGAVQDWEYEEQQRVLEPGELLCMATDGVFEAANPEGEMYGKERLRALLRREHDKGAQELLDVVLQDLRSFRGQESFEDDVTLLLLKVL